MTRAAGAPGSEVLWRPSAERAAAARLTEFAAAVRQRHGVDVAGDYAALWRWSV